MVSARSFAISLMVWCVTTVLPAPGQDNAEKIPEALRSWQSWVLWDRLEGSSPTPFNTHEQPLSVWPSQLKIQAEKLKASWTVQVTVFSESWVALPGDDKVWPQSVFVDDKPVAVITHLERPSIRMPPGSYSIQGEFNWSQTPEKIFIPSAFGIVELSFDGEVIEAPNWDTQGNLWLNRVQANEDAKDQITTQSYRVIEDGLPMWLRTQIDVTVSGKSREEEIGYVLPEGWNLSFVSSPIPVAVDEQGLMKAQVRAGTWQVLIDAFRSTDLHELRYAEGIKPGFETELIGVRARSDLRTAELQGANPVDVQMTTFPKAWRDLPVYEWKTNESLKWVEKTRGMGTQSNDRLTIQRRLWLDDDGTSFTYRDELQGQPKEFSRLDVAKDYDLGVVRIDGMRQLITENPTTGDQGIELRSTNPKIQAIGRSDRLQEIQATGWKTDADRLNLSLVLPPGWRVFALFGADRVQGDWLTAWSLLDLFLLLIFSVAVFRLWGVPAGAIAFVAFGLSYHEPGSPRLTWLFLLIPTAILHVVKEGRMIAWLRAWRYLAVALLLLNLLPFAAIQIQNALYPQLERVGVPYSSRTMFEWLSGTYNAGAVVSSYASEDDLFGKTRLPYESNAVPQFNGKAQRNQRSSMQNMQIDPGTSIQTGIAEPKWAGNHVECWWDGPVSSDQTIRPLFISATLHRWFTIARLALLSLLVAMFLQAGFSLPGWSKKAVPTLVSVLIFSVASVSPNFAWCQIPDKETLQLLRERLLAPSDAYPNAAEIPSMKLRLENSKLFFEAEVHAALEVAVPVPGRVPTWSPLTIKIDDQPAVVCRREDGYLWVLVPSGVHRLTVEGLLDETTEWVWTSELLPKFLQIDAPEWNVTGLSPEGQPESQVFFVRKEQQTEGAATYDQKNFRSIVSVERQLEVGLVWKVHNTVTRLSQRGKALSLRVPLLAGERVLSSTIVNGEGEVEINLGADEAEFRWESEMTPTPELRLVASNSNQAIEKWSLISSPVWNVTSTGLKPIYQSGRPELIPTWHPWPGEEATLTFRRPKPIPGEVLTIQQVNHHVVLGSRQRTSSLSLQVESALGGEFPLALPDTAVVTSVKLDDRPLPIRRDGGKYLVSLQPGSQSIEIDWKSDQDIKTLEAFPAIRLPTDSANISTRIQVPESRWILWAKGPMRGPAVRFWVMLVTAVGVALALSLHSKSPLKRFEWVLLALGLTQVHAFAGLIVVGWLFFIAWRATKSPASMNPFAFKLIQLSLIGVTIIAMGILIVIVGQGLLGSPEMFVVGNNSYGNHLDWFEPKASVDLPIPQIVTVSVWYYRLLMLAWALWLANALLRWLKSGWLAFSNGGVWTEPKPRTPVLRPEKKFD